MAICDAKTVFANNASIAGTAGSSYIGGSTVWSGAIADGASQIVDQMKAGDAVGQELTIKVVVGGTAAIVGASSASTAQFRLQTSDTTTAGDFKDLILTPAISVDGAKPGAVLSTFRVPAGTKRYLRVIATLGGATVTSGKVSVYATRDL